MDVQQQLEIFREFFQELYTANTVLESDMESYLSELALLLLSSEHVAMLDTPITVDEIVKTIKGMKVNVAPDLDGYFSEFYKKFG